MKRVTAIVFSVLLGLSVIGCGGGTASGNNSGASPVAAEEAGGSEEKEAAAEGITDQAVSTAGDVGAVQADSDAAGAGTTGSGQAQTEGTAEATAALVEPAGLDPAVKYKEEEETILDTDLYSIKVTGYDPDYHYEPEEKDNDRVDSYDCFAVKIRFENKSSYVFRSEGMGDQLAAVNRDQGFYPSFIWDAEKPKDSAGNSYMDGFEVAAGESVDGRIQFRLDDLAEAGISSIDEIIFQFSGILVDNNVGGMTVYREFLRPRAAAYPTGKTADEITPAGQTDTEKITVLADKEGILVAFIPEDANTGLPFYVENHTDDMIRVSVSDQKINGEKYYMMVGGKKHESSSSRIADVLPGCHLQATNLYGIRSFLEDNGFDAMTEYSAKLTVSRPVEGGSGDIMEAQYGKGEEIFTEDVAWKAEE